MVGACHEPEGQGQQAAATHCVIEDRCVVAASPAAQTCGVQPGMSLAAASALVPEITPWPRDPLREAALVERVALALTRYTSAVVLQTDGVLLEVSASLRLFGGARKLGAAMAQTALASGVSSVAWAAAPTATAAGVLARTEKPSQALPKKAGKPSSRPTHPAQRRITQVEQRLDALPLAEVLVAWQQPSALIELLHGIGCRNLGDVRALPRTGLKRRGGAALMDRLEQAYGEASEPQTWYEPPPQFAMGLELLHRADDAASLVFAAQRLVQPLVGWLAQRWLAATRVSLRMKHETLHKRRQADTVLSLACAEPSRDATQITLLLRERLQRLALPAPVYAITLVLDESVSHAGRATAFWRSSQTQAQSERSLIDRLTARLGPQAVLRAQAHADHRPEKAMQWVPAHQALQNLTLKTSTSQTAPAKAQTPGGPTQAPGSRAFLGATPPRPTWLLAQPLALPCRDERPLYQGMPLLIVSRAERIEAGWFNGTLASRDYHQAVGADHRCFWVYRERSAEQAPRWFLHGVFA